MFIYNKKFFVVVVFQFWVFRGRLGVMRKTIKINRSSFLTVFLDIKLYNTRKKNKKNRVWFVFSAFV